MILPRTHKSGVVCLLPARNCEADLPGWFTSVEPVVDAVIALDDGSTDGTCALLEAHPLVYELLKNPIRNSYAGWDDAANRIALLKAAACLRPEWILFLDADERLPPEEGSALREFVRSDALPGVAYGFRIYRMIGDVARYDPRPIWVYRLFGWEPDQRLPSRRLHLQPVPSSIPRDRWMRTTIRLQHLGGATHERRLARYEKYRESDPQRKFQRSYRNLLASPRVERVWRPRAPDFPVLFEGNPPPDPEAPILSAIIISRDDERRIERAVRSVVEQESSEPFEVIVVTSGSDRTAEIVREQFPSVTLIALPRPALPGEARNAGLKAARGRYVSFPGSHVELPQGSIVARIRAHSLGYAMVTGSIKNGTLTRAGWASYFLDHSTALPGRPSGALRGAPAHCSYTRAALLEIGGFREDMRAGEDTVANRELVRRGHRAYRSSELVLVHHSPCTTVRRLLLHHFTRGRWWGRILREDAAGGTASKRGSRAAPSVRTRMKSTTAQVERWGGELTTQYREVRPLVLVGAVAAWAGARYELMRFWDRPDGGDASAVSLSARSPFVPLAKSAARRHVVPEDLFLALICQESGWQPAAVSPAGAIGLAQLMPETARTLEVDPWDPKQNLEGAARYLRGQYERFGSWPLALAAYNAGPHQVDRYGRVPPFAETRRYVERILRLAGLSGAEGS